MAETPANNPLVSLRGVGKVYEGAVQFRALQDVDLDIFPGEFISIVGQSGSGKSTLLNILGTLDRPTEGTMVLNGENVINRPQDSLSKLRARTLGFVFQFHYLLPDFTVLENVLMPLMSTGRPITRSEREEAIGLLRRVGVEATQNKLATQISGGQQQRVAIARALMGKKPLILADEPTGNLDSVTGEEAFQLMREFNREDKVTFIIVTHDEEIAHRTDRIIRVTDGRIVSDERLTNPAESTPV